MRGDDYKFMQIVDAIASINQRVNLIGIVVETGLPKSTRGTDYFCSLKIVDKSRTNLGIFVSFFADTMEKLPQVDSVGDIILLCQVMMKTRGTEVYVNFDKRYSSFAIFEGRDFSSSSRNEFCPYQISPKYKAREQDKKIVMDLRNWLIQLKLHGLNDSLSLKEIKEGSRFNLLCKILHVEGKNDEWMLFLWDGTDTPPASIGAKLEDEMENPLPLQLGSCSLSRDVLCTFPPVGSVLRMIINQRSEKINMNFIHINKWVKFVNIKIEVHAALWRAVLMPFSRLHYLPDDDDRVLACQRSYEERVPSKWGRMPFTSFPWPSPITGTDHPDVPFVTLMNVLTHPEVTGKFKCVVRVVAIFPWRIDDFRSPSGIYRVRLTLEDPTARLHAFLYAEDGMKFFGNDQSSESLVRKRDMLLGIGGWQTTKRNPPWIQCCLKSYYVDKRDIWGSRNYRIFGTTLVD
ncbi:hypothetical protein RD792_005630 [Penstemon davidsonii]|uniref:Telomeric single stranded DNA binding POT1/Cdc13 domain-containing protein n=1 Tax=Penstemon davidsonii TaxID=160366 RepID=A0ABR0DEP2_9LAMI|nr:hypothetical protein RD792_005630 [Penstemon davidsonii]